MGDDMDVLSIFSEKIEDIISHRDVNCILLIGSGAEAYREDLDKVRDIDLFVIYENSSSPFEREVINFKGVEFDISYISLRELKTGVREEWSFLISSLYKFRYVYKKDDKAEEVLRKINELYNNGPRKLKKIEIDSIRFEINQYLAELQVRRKDKFNCIFLTNNLLKRVLVAYFELNNLWIPKDKKILNAIMERDRQLFDKVVQYIKKDNLLIKIELLEDIIKYVLNPFGGTLMEWKKGPFPLE